MEKYSKAKYKANYKKFLKAQKKAEIETAKEDKQLWQSYITNIDSIKNSTPLQKAETWLHQVMVLGKGFIDSLDWTSQFTVNKFADQEAIVYFISRGKDCNIYIKKMATRLKEHKKESERFWKELENWSNAKLKFLGFQKRKPKKNASHFEILPRSSFSLANDDTSHEVSSMIRTFQWCDIGGYDIVLDDYANRLKEDVNRGGEINEEIASQTLFYLCRSDLAIDIMGDNLVKLLDIIEMPDHQLTIPWHRWNTDQMSLMAGIETNSIFAYAASIAFSEKRLRQNINKKLVTQALEWLLETQEENGSWKISTLLEEQSITGTCMAVHALAINKPRGWKLAVSQACSWLLTKQDDFGFWYESPFPPTDPIHLTVLVLDTLGLANEKSKITFDIDEKPSHVEKTAQINIHGNVSSSTIIVGNKNTVRSKKK